MKTYIACYALLVGVAVFVGVVKFMAWWQIAMHGCVAQ